MKKSIVYSLLTLSLSLGLIGFGDANSDKSRPDSNSPKNVIKKFVKIFEQKKLDSLVPFVTQEPVYVKKQALEEFERIHFPNEFKNDEKRIGENLKSAQFYGSPRRREVEKREVAEEMISTGIFFDQNRYLEEIVSLHVFVNEARARVNLGGYNSKKEQLGTITYDFFLHKRGSDWKIFRISLPHLNEKYDQYKFFAKPANEQNIQTAKITTLN